MPSLTLEQDTTLAHLGKDAVTHKSNSQLSPSTIPQRFLSHPGDVSVVAVGFSGGQGKLGVDTGPSSLINAGLLTQISDDLGYNVSGDKTVRDYNVMLPQSSSNRAQEDPPHRGMKNPRSVSKVTEDIATQVYEQARTGKMVLTLGGDHSIAIGTIAGTSRAVRERLGAHKEIAVIWVDAHADINTPETSDSGNIHGMPVAFLTGLAKSDRQDIFGWLSSSTSTSTSTSDSDRPLLSPSKLVYIGLRDVDRGEKQILRQNSIKAFSMHDVDRHGIGKVVEMALAHIGADTPIHLSFDIDALDPMWAPSTGTPVRGGLTLREGDYIAECVHASGQLVAMDLVEVNPCEVAAQAAETIRAGVSVVRCALGDTLL